MGSVIIAVVITLLVTAVVVYFVTTAYYKKVTEAKIGNADEKAREIIDEAVKTAETKKREAMLEAKEESIRVKNDLDKEVKERRAEIGRSERRIVQKEENLDKKLEAIEKREAGFAAKEEEINRQKAQVAKLNEERVKELERISGLTSEQAKDYLLKTVEEDVKIDTAKLIKEMEHKAKEEADKKAKEYVVTAIQKCAADHVAETTISVVQLPNDEMKGRIIGREGRNIRSIETITGVELIIDDTPEAITISSFDPVRREIARLTLEHLIQDGRIHPTKIEECFDKATREVNQTIKTEGEKAVLSANCGQIHPELVKLLGKLKYRTSYGQSVLKHSREVSYIAGLMAAELGADEKQARRAGLLHDIGKALDHEMEGSHIALGVEWAKKYKESDAIVHAIAAHHGEIECKTIVACLVQAADAVSAARPGARRENIENYIKRLEQLEEISTSFDGVERAYAIQAGREVRVMVKPDVINDEKMPYIAHEIAKKIESEMEYPGQIKVNIIRESRASDIAK